MRKNDEELIDMYDQIKEKVKVGEFYSHYKHPGEKRYRIVSIGLMEDTWIPMVTYEHIRSGVMTVRTLENFLEKVNFENKLVDRFTLID
jgi:hypothetical protein